MYRIITIHFFCLTSNNKVRLIAVSSLKKRFLMATFHFRLTVLSYSMQTCFILILLTLICHLVNYCDKKHYFLFYHIITIDFFCLTSKSKVRLIVISSLEKKTKSNIFNGNFSFQANFSNLVIVCKHFSFCYFWLQSAI